MKTALITGATGGIGRALCSVFRADGYYVIATDRALPDQGNINIAIDLAELVLDAEYRQNKLAQIAKALSASGLNVLVNNAALQVIAPVERLSLDSFRRSQDINVTAPFLLTQALLGRLEQARGSVINIASIHARLTKPEFVAYATSKTALLGLTQALAVELGARVRVNAISPAAIATDMLKAGFEGRPEAYAELEAHHPSGRVGTPDEVAKVALFLASDQACFINGANIGIDGAIAARLHDPV